MPAAVFENANPQKTWRKLEEWLSGTVIAELDSEEIKG